MFIKIILNYLIGYVSIVVEGYYIERFINICKSKNIYFWNMKREKASILHANVGIKEFKELKAIAKKLKCHLKIERKRGLPFIFNKYKKRKIFFALLLLVMILLTSLSNYVWNVEITGTQKISKEEILIQLEDAGLKVGTSKNKIDIKNIINEIRLNRDVIYWILINVE